MKKIEYTREVLIDVLKAYRRMIERSAKEYPGVVCDDIMVSIEAVLNEIGIEK